MKRARFYLLLDLVMGIGFLLEALSGFVLWLVLPHVGGYRGGRGTAVVDTFIFSRNTWLGLHDWTAVVLVLGILLHVVLHWKWITCIVRKTWQDATRSLAKSSSRLESPRTEECPS